MTAVAPELLQRIAEAAAVLEARRLVAEAALDDVILAKQALRTTKNEAQVKVRRAALRDVEEARRIAHEAHQQAQGALVTLYRGRDNRVLFHRHR